MSLTPQQLAQLQKLVSIAEKLIADGKGKEAKGAKPARKVADKSRLRRSGKDLDKFRRLLKEERRRGVPVAELARKHGVSASYIYQVA
jgi:hypothetical protein